ncbi:enolase C-terminal domain-like protein [Kitasatospora cineracea]|uniref:L-alanine-DL-glutamate epimerase-like enolase superfamily enzyme n=1 Tax=Kitasatospora cineracea TaxID=88074 RepID=A0A3N4RDV4_9ACTN|nr:enolase C-terminal domain-like protein [Kitasatospora cineracea]RPE29549.1 L-alanine-DL-glutamate epimerase-like enolase superfamily enzyme [Kitasatospora cineracea]
MTGTTTGTTTTGTTTIGTGTAGVTGRVGLQADVAVVPHRLDRPFRISHMTIATVDRVRLRLIGSCGRVRGEGEIAADLGYGQDGPAIAAEARLLAGELTRASGTEAPDRLGELLAGAAAEFSAPARMLVEMAFLDRAARTAGLPVWRLLDLPEPGPVRLLHTVPIDEEIPAAVRPVKIKLGGPRDREVLRGLVGVAGPVVLDVNRGWGRAEWEEVRPLLQQVAPAVLEDPVRDDALLPEVRAALPGTTVLLDEGIDSRAAVERAARTADGANVKLMRFGGLLPGLDALRHLAGRGTARMLGCFLEPPRSIAYAAQLAGLCDWTDLDGHFWLCDDPPVLGYRLDSSRPGIPAIRY